MITVLPTVKPPIKDTPKEDNLPTKDNLKVPFSIQNSFRKRTTSLQRTKGWVPSAHACPLHAGGVPDCGSTVLLLIELILNYL